MEVRTIFQNISPIDHRYSISEKALFDALGAWISEEASIASNVKAEIAPGSVRCIEFDYL
jgi:adenylosuccinate lyase